MIEAYERLNRERRASETRKRAAAYCRVSTDKEDQANSFESQQTYFRQYIQNHPGWELYGIFADEGLSGTTTKKRREFQRMIDCAKNGDFDLILTKEISRFARNTLDSIYYTRELKKWGVGVLFLNDGINTLEGDGELRLSILASIAQEESRRTSQRIKWGQKRRMEQGVVFGRSMLGYDVQRGRMTINEEGAAIVRLIFHKLTEEGKGAAVIARELSEAGISPLRSHKWNSSVILRILRNEKYCGDLVQKKTYTPDYLTHEKKRNQGQEEFVILKNHHPPLISRELFEKANRILDERAHSPKGRKKYSGRYPFSGKIKCGRCGGSFCARPRHQRDKSPSLTWRCRRSLCPGASPQKETSPVCSCRQSLKDEEIGEILRFVLRAQGADLEKAAETLLAAVRPVVFEDFPPAPAAPAGKRPWDSPEAQLEAIQESLQGLLEDFPGEAFPAHRLLHQMVIQEDGCVDVYLKHSSLPWRLKRQRDMEPPKKAAP